MMPRLCSVLALTALVATSRLAAADAAVPPPAASPDGGNAGVDPDAEGVSLVDSAMLDIVQAQSALFAQAKTGNITEENFTRRAAKIAGDYDRLVARNPNNTTLLILYGKFLRQIGSDDDAHKIFHKANELDPNLAVVKQELGNWLAEHGQYPQALAMYLKAVDLEPKQPVYHFGVGQLLFAYRDQFIKDGAFTRESLDKTMLKAFKEALLLDPDNLDFRFRLGEAYYDIEKPDWAAALKVWNSFDSLKLDAFDADTVRLHKARVFMELGRLDDARPLLKDDVAPVLRHTLSELRARLANGGKPLPRLEPEPDAPAVKAPGDDHPGKSLTPLIPAAPQIHLPKKSDDEGGAK